MSRINRKLRCTLAFFGIDRRLDLTGEAIQRCVFQPASQRFEVSSVGFLWAPTRIENPRSGEQVDLPEPRFQFLPKGRYESASPLDLMSENRFLELKAFGDFWNDSLHSLGNLYLQLISLSRTTDMVLATRPELVIFLRPDLLYQDNFSHVLDMAATTVAPSVFLPHWQPHGGMNDRFAICCGEEAIRAYGYRIEAAQNFCRENNSALHSERLVRHALADLNVTRVGLRAARMRINGVTKAEDYSWRGWKPALRVLVGAVRQRIFPK